jgi:hypothetical protein
MNKFIPVTLCTAALAGALSVWSSNDAQADDQSAAATRPATAAVTDEPIDLESTHRITLHLKSATPAAAVGALTQRCQDWLNGAQILYLRTGPTTGPWADVEPKRDFDATEEPLALAILRMCDAYQLFHDRNRGEDDWDLSPFISNNDLPAATDSSIGNIPTGPTSVTGPFVVRAREVVRDRQLDPLPQPSVNLPGASAVTSNTSIEYWLVLDVMAEPGIKIIQTASRPAITRMVDDKDTSLWDAQRYQVPITYSDSDPTTNVRVEFFSPDEKATRIAEFKGSFELQVVSHYRRYEWTGLDDGQPRDDVVEGAHMHLDALSDSAGSPNQQAIINVDRGSMSNEQLQSWIATLGGGSHIRIYDRQGSLLTDAFRWYPIK